MSIRYYRLKEGLSQAELGRKLEVCGSSVSLWEHGKVSPLKKHVRRMCRLFGCAPEELLAPDTAHRPEKGGA